MTQTDLVKQLGSTNGAEIILVDTWGEGLRQVRTPYVSLIEPDCVFSSSYYSSNVGIMVKAQPRVAGSKGRSHTSGIRGGGGDMKFAMLASCLGINNFANRIYNYRLDKIKEGEFAVGSKKAEIKGWHVQPFREKLNSKPYEVQIAFVPGAVIRVSAIKDIIDDELWDDKDLVKLSTAVSFYLWNNGRRIKVNPNTTYVSLDKKLEIPPLFSVDIPDRVKNLFSQEYIGAFGT